MARGLAREVSGRDAPATGHQRLDRAGAARAVALLHAKWPSAVRRTGPRQRPSAVLLREPQRPTRWRVGGRSHSEGVLRDQQRDPAPAARWPAGAGVQPVTVARRRVLDVGVRRATARHGGNPGRARQRLRPGRTAGQRQRYAVPRAGREHQPRAQLRRRQHPRLGPGPQRRAGCALRPSDELPAAAGPHCPAVDGRRAHAQRHPAGLGHRLGSHGLERPGRSVHPAGNMDRSTERHRWCRWRLPDPASLRAEHPRPAPLSGRTVGVGQRHTGFRAAGGRRRPRVAALDREACVQPGVRLGPGRGRARPSHARRNSR